MTMNFESIFEMMEVVSGISAVTFENDFAEFNLAIDGMKAVGLTEDEAVAFVGRHWKMPNE